MRAQRRLRHENSGAGHGTDTAAHHITPCTDYYLRQEGYVLPVFVCLFVCLSVCQQHRPNSKSYKRIFLKFSGNVGNGKNYQWFNFGGDPEGIPDSGLLWNFRYHCFKGGIRKPLSNRIQWRHLANNMALTEVCRLWLLSSFNCYLLFCYYDFDDFDSLQSIHRLVALTNL